MIVRAGWSRSPSILEVPAWPWLERESRLAGVSLDLATVPDTRWDALAALAGDAVWLMGVWERSPESVRRALSDSDLPGAFVEALPDWTDEDVVGSPYAVRDYRVADRLGGDDGLARARAALADRGVRLVLDFVPNHTAVDHPWVAAHPDRFVAVERSSAGDVPEGAFARGDRYLAHGRDPFYPAWTDTAQLDLFAPDTIDALSDVLRSIAERCDGVRCDMAMLVLSDVFERTWHGRVGPRPALEPWDRLLKAARDANPALLAIAEAYWGLEPRLIELGFDLAYDKTLYDRLATRDVAGVRDHLRATARYADHLLRFVENHDEPRAAARWPAHLIEAVTVAASTLPGGRMFLLGQECGARVRAPVQLGRGPDDAPTPELLRFHASLRRLTASTVVRCGRWRPCVLSGWPDDPSYDELLAWSWAYDGTGVVVVANLSDAPARARVRLPWEGLVGHGWDLVDAITGERFRRDGTEIAREGLFVELASGGYHVLVFRSGPRGFER